MSLGLIIIRLIAWSMRQLAFAGYYGSRPVAAVTAYTRLRGAAPTGIIIFAMLFDLALVLLLTTVAEGLS